MNILSKKTILESVKWINLKSCDKAMLAALG